MNPSFTITFGVSWWHVAAGVLFVAGVIATFVVTRSPRVVIRQSERFRNHNEKRRAQ